MGPSDLIKGGKDEEPKLLKILLARCQKSREELRVGKILTLSIDERVFSKLENRVVMITGRNI